jgi:hypothetical protein
LCPSACFEHFNAIIENKEIKQIRHDVMKSHNTLKAMKNAALCILMLGPTDQIIQNSKELRCLFHIFQFLIPFYFLSTKRLSTVHNKHKCSTIRLGCSPTSRVTSTSGAFHVTFAAIINIFFAKPKHSKRLKSFLVMCFNQPCSFWLSFKPLKPNCLIDSCVMCFNQLFVTPSTSLEL